MGLVDATGERVAVPLGVALAAAEMLMPTLARAVPMAVGVVVVPTRPIELMPSTLCRKTILHQMVNNLRPLVRKYEAVNLYVALLRGINVGGSNLIRMTALKACFEAQGFGNVTTYIQSGNVLFTAGRASQHALIAGIERALSKTFAYQSRVVVRSLEQMKSAVENAPTGFGRQPSVYRDDVIFFERSPHGGRSPEERERQAGCRLRICRRRRPVLLSADQQGRPESSQSRRRDAGLPAHDDSKLEHDRPACRADEWHPGQ